MGSDGWVIFYKKTKLLALLEERFPMTKKHAGIMKEWSLGRPNWYDVIETYSYSKHLVVRYAVYGGRNENDIHTDWLICILANWFDIDWRTAELKIFRELGKCEQSRVKVWT